MQGILLVNLGSPDSTELSDVKRYLDEFLMDKRVIDYNYIKRSLLVRGIILRTRPARTSEAYKKIWKKEGSPLIIISRNIRKKLQDIVDIPVSLGMRYGRPSIEDGLKELVDKGVKEVVLFPLYPQYAMSSTETVIAKAREVQQRAFPGIQLHIVPPFYNDEAYIDAMSGQIRKHLPADFDKLIFSFHGIPERHFYKYGHKGVTDLGTCFNNTDPRHNQYCYLYQSNQSMQLISRKLGLRNEQVVQTFQSRLGREKWVEPYTDIVLEELPGKGVKKIAIVCPAFVSDCLETLEEIQMEGARAFKEHGGEEYTYIPCLNENEAWIEVIRDLSLRAFKTPYTVPMLMQ